MIDKKKLTQRLNKGSKLKQHPLLNLYILVAAFFQFFGELIGSEFLKMLKPLPTFLMTIYIHKKNNARKHLVPSLVQVSLFISFLSDTLSIIGDNSTNTIVIIIKIIAHIIFIVSFCFGDQIRRLSQFRILRKIAYLAIFSFTFTLLYYLQDKFPHRIVYCTYYIALAVQLTVALWRYQITLRASFLFTLSGTGLLFISGWVSFWASGIGNCIVQLLYFCGNFGIMHGALHQSNLQFQIDKLQDNLRRNY